jgi:IclR family mhp operon transcriptional activator
MAVPVMLGAFPVASINITWLQRRSETATVVQRHLGALKRAAQAISADLAANRDA